MHINKYPIGYHLLSFFFFLSSSSSTIIYYIYSPGLSGCICMCARIWVFVERKKWKRRWEAFTTTAAEEKSCIPVLERPTMAAAAEWPSRASRFSRDLKRIFRECRNWRRSDGTRWKKNACMRNAMAHIQTFSECRDNVDFRVQNRPCHWPIGRMNMHAHTYKPCT